MANKNANDNENKLADLSADERQELAPDAGGSGAPHVTPNKEQLLSGAERPDEDALIPRFIEAEPQEEVDPLEAEIRRMEERGHFDIPRDLDKVITPDARARFAEVVLQDGDVTTAPGRYRNVDKLDEVVEVQQGAVIPDGLRLISDQYLIAEPNRTALLGRRLRSING